MDHDTYSNIFPYLERAENVRKRWSIYVDRMGSFTFLGSRYGMKEYYE